MKHETVIDTIALQVNFFDENKCDTAMDELFAKLEKYNLYKDKNSNEIKYKFNLIATIDKGCFSYRKTNNEKAQTIWYLTIKLAGLKRYLDSIDTASTNCLLLICSYLNTNKLAYHVTQLDVAIDIFTKFDNVLALCTNRSPTTKYYKANEEQKYLTTTYIEKFKNEQQQKEAVLRATLYDKTLKHTLQTTITRFEISFQKKFFKNNKFDVGAIYREFQRYQVLYIPNQKKKQAIMDKYDSIEIIRQKDVHELYVERLRLHPNVQALMDFISRMYMVHDTRLEYFLLS